MPGPQRDVNVGVVGQRIDHEISVGGERVETRGGRHGDAERVNHFGELIYPNLMLSLSRDHVAAFVLRPMAYDRTIIECKLLFHPDEATKPDFDPADAADFWHMVNLQDWSICERVQRGMASRTFTHGWYATMEDPSLDIRRWWMAKMNA